MTTKVGRLSVIHTEIYQCKRCALHSGRTRTVPGAGDPNAEILFIGEAPGEQEDKQGLPFVGRSGQYLDQLLAGIGLSRDDVFIANVVKCRPANNRDPLSDEIEACNPYLRQQIEIIDPLVIATLGRFSMNMFFPNEKISRIHGQPQFGARRAYYPFFHPAAALRNPSLKQDMEADFARLLDLVEEVRTRRASENELSLEVNEEIIEVETIREDDDDAPDTPQQMGLFE